MIDTELKLVLGHKPPLFDVPSGWHISTTNPNNKKDFYIEDNSIIKKNGDIDCLAEYGYLFCLAKKLKLMPEIKIIKLVQYRKILSNTKISDIYGNDPWGINYITQENFKLYQYESKLDIMMQGNNWGLLLPPIIEFNNNNWIHPTVLHNYSHYHCIEDILRFTIDAIKSEELTRKDADDFLNDQQLIYSGMSLGVYPTELFIKIYEKAERIIMYHYAHGWVKSNDPYNYRNMAFCIERILSYLLLKELNTRNISIKNNYSNLIIITEEEKFTRGEKTSS